MFTRGPKQLQNKDRASANTRCQKCLKLGHYSYQCTNPRPYVPRPSRSKELAMGGGPKRDEPSVETPEEFKKVAGIGLADKILLAKEAERERIRAEEAKKAAKSDPKRGKKSRRRSPSGSESDSASDSEPDSDDSIPDSHASRSPRRRRRRSASSDSESPSPEDDPPPRQRRRYTSDSPSPDPHPRDRSASPPKRRPPPRDDSPATSASSR